MAACKELQENYRKSIEQALIGKLNELKEEQSKVLQDKGKTWGNSDNNGIPEKPSPGDKDSLRRLKHFLTLHLLKVV